MSEIDKDQVIPKKSAELEPNRSDDMTRPSSSSAKAEVPVAKQESNLDTTSNNSNIKDNSSSGDASDENGNPNKHDRDLGKDDQADEVAMTDDDEVMGEDNTGEEDIGEGGGKQKRNRLPLNASSLGLLTSKFMNLLKSSITGTIHLNDAAYSLGVSKRRLFDVTNVLEGVGVIVKQNRNIIRWRGLTDLNYPSTNNTINASDKTKDVADDDNKKDDMKSEADRLDKIRNEIDDLYKEDSKLDIYLAMLKKMSQMKENQFCFQKDILDAITSLKDGTSVQTKDESLCILTIRAPSGSTMEVPHPIEGHFDGMKKHYELRICNETAKIPMSDIDIPPTQHRKRNHIKGHNSKNTYTSRSGAGSITKDNSSDIENEINSPQKQRVVSVWDDQWINNEKPEQESKISTPTLSEPQSKNNPNEDFEEITSLPSSLPGAPGSNQTVDPIDVYLMTSRYDSELDKYVSKSNARRLDPVVMMADAMIEGTYLTSSPPLSKRRKTNSAIFDSYFPWLDNERGVSDFFRTL